MCGCGEKTRIATHNDKSKGWVKGMPLKFALGHNLTKLNKGKTVSAIGNKSISSGGYVCVQVACRTRVYEHILVAEKALGRKLVNLGKGNPMSEVVHHIDGNKQNNAPSNLLICTHKYHIELHHRLEKSDEWPEFPKITRNTKEKKSGNLSCQG
jgi:hypothetical protein